MQFILHELCQLPPVERHLEAERKKLLPKTVAEKKAKK